ncbi:MAG: lytic polysaccharide monooxygenase [Micromonosporaceae bacterium]
MRTSVLTVAGAVGATTLIAVLLPAAPATAHGSVASPASRSYTCWREGPENPQSDACKAAVAAGGTQAFYDWNEVSRIDAAGRHREIIPDGQLCGAGREKYRGLNLARADWPAQRVSPGAFTVTLHATAPHAGSDFEFYVTRDGYSPTQPLRWGDLVPLQSWRNVNPTSDQRFTITLPTRSGRHILYMIWQRVAYSEEAFYSCSDIDFGGGPTPTPTASPSPTTSPTASPSPTTTTSPTPPPPSEAPWAAGTAYRVGDRVTYDGRRYECRQAHTALQGWEPPHTPALWLAL